MTPDADCVGCRRSAGMRVSPAEVDRLLRTYLATRPDEPLADEAVAEARLGVCRSCPDVRYGGTTCRHCGCLVEVRARLADKHCPASPSRW